MEAERESRKSRVLLIYRRMIPSIRLCGHSQLSKLAEMGRIEYRAVQEMRLKAADMDWADVALLGRSDSWYELRLTRILRDSGRYIIYILDDDLLNIPPEVKSADYYGQAEIQDNIGRMIAMSDAILSPSPLLLEKYARDGRAALMAEEPAIDPVPYRPHAQDAPVRIGFAGSIDRTGNLEGILKDALLRIKAEFGERVEFEFFGAIPSFAEQLDAKSIPYCDSYDDYRAQMNDAGWDIGLAPLEQNDFNAFKHYNKFCEYAAAGIAGIYSNCLPYTRIPDAEPVAVFCENTPEAWCGKLRGLIVDRQEREARRRRCCERANGPLSVAACAEMLWRELSRCDVQSRERRPVSGHLSWMKAVNIEKRGKNFLKRRGISAPMLAVRRMIDSIAGRY